MKVLNEERRTRQRRKGRREKREERREGNGINVQVRAVVETTTQDTRLGNRCILPPSYIIRTLDPLNTLEYIERGDSNDEASE